MLMLKQVAIHIDVKNIHSKMKGLLFGILLFFFIWDVNFSFLPFTSHVHLAALGILVFPFTFKFKMYKEDIAFLGIYFMMLVYATFVVIFHRTGDYVFIIDEMIRFIVVPFFGAWLVAYAGRDILKSKEKLFEYIIRVNLVQSVIIILEFTVPTFKKIILATQVLTTGGVGQMVEEGIRAYGLGAGYDIGAFCMSFSLLFTIYLYFENNVQKKKMKYLLYFIIQTLAGLLMARSIFFGVVVSALFFLCVGGPNMGKKKFKIIAAIIAIFIVILVVINVFGSKLSHLTKEYGKTLTWIFEFFIWDKVKASGKETNSLMTLQGMYTLPAQMKTWLFGDGRYVSTFGSSSPYKNMDPFYMRFFYFWGIPGIVLYLLFLKKTIDNVKKKHHRCLSISENQKNEKLFHTLLAFIFIMNLVINLKLVAHSLGLIFLLMWFFYLKQQNIGRKSIAYVKRMDTI